MAVTDGRPASAIAVPILYRNWRGLTAVRQIIPQTKEGYGSHTWFAPVAVEDRHGNGARRTTIGYCHFLGSFSDDRGGEGT
jgi:hypothetical protein